MEYVLCAFVGLAVGLLFGRSPKQKQPPAMSDEEKRKAEKAWREYRNFLNYDGFSKEEE